MKEMTLREKLLAAISVVFCICSLAVMLNQFKLSGEFKNAVTPETTVQPQISWFEDSNAMALSPDASLVSATIRGETYVINTKTNKIHSPDCIYAVDMKAENRSVIVTDDLSEYTDNGYSICSKCGASH